MGVHLRDTYGRVGAVDRHDLLKDIAHRQTVGPVHLARAPSVARGRLWLWCTIADRPPTVGGQLQLRTTTPSINLLPTSSTSTGKVSKEEFPSKATRPDWPGEVPSTGPQGSLLI